MDRTELREKLFDGCAPLDEFAAALGLNPRTVRNWTKVGLPHSKRGNLTLIPIEAAKAWLRSGKVRDLRPIPEAARRGRAARPRRAMPMGAAG